MAYETPMSGADEDSMHEGMEHDEMGGMDHDKEESMSLFAPKAFAMGTKFKPGDIMEVKVVEIDPETGDFELKYNTGDGEEDHEYGEGPSMRGFDAAMDKAGMPEKE